MPKQRVLLNKTADYEFFFIKCVKKVSFFLSSLMWCVNKIASKYILKILWEIFFLWKFNFLQRKRIPWHRFPCFFIIWCYVIVLSEKSSKKTLFQHIICKICELFLKDGFVNWDFCFWSYKGFINLFFGISIEMKVTKIQLSIIKRLVRLSLIKICARFFA